MERSLAWICRAQDRARSVGAGSGGVGSYDFSGWSTGYPEVTGYTIPTVWEYARFLERDDLARRAVAMADWEIRIQHPDGGWEGGNQGDGLPPVVFNTGQVIRGLTRTYEETGREDYLAAARRAADWIVASQDADGSWTTSNHRGLKRVYDTYVAAPLARLGTLVDSEAYAQAARRNCEFALANQRDNGWFANCDNSAEFNDVPVTHTLCYTADGLIETGEILGEESYVAAGARTAEAMTGAIEPDGRLAGRFDSDWSAAARWVCLTGSAQLGIVLMRLYARDGDPSRLEAAERLAGYLARVQQLNSIGRDRSGALAGSYPIWGSYAPLRFPCWATKYYLDLLLAVRRAGRDPRPDALTVA
jgi:hypothetical protein